MTTSPTRDWRVSDLAVSLIRTLVPVGVAAAITWAGTRWGIVINEQTSAQAVVWITAGVAAGYFAAARWLERLRGTGRAAIIARWLGRWMLGGIIRQPVYIQPGQRITVLTAEGTRPPR